MRNLGRLFRLEVVEILVDRIAGVNLAVHTVQSRHQHRGKREIRIASRIGEAHFDPARLRARHVGHTDRRRTVARGIGEIDRRFEPRHEAFVRIRSGIGDRVQRLRMLDHTADVIERELGQAGIPVAREQVLAVLPDRLMHMHAGTVVADDRLRHERRRFAVRVRGVVHAILEDLQPVRALHERSELGPDLVLASSRDFVMVHLHFDAHLFHGEAHRRADILQRVDRRNRKITPLDRRAVTHVAALEFFRR